ncbi:MAG: hypothetical protein ABSH50_32470 [Bryobacteraceae bacterium]|jgi:hypothetical protein
MESWIAKKAEESRRRQVMAQTLTQRAADIWGQLRSALRENVAEFNALFGKEDPARLVEYEEEQHRSLVKCKAQPDTYVEVQLDPDAGHIVYTRADDAVSTMASEMRIFAVLATPGEILDVEMDGQGDTHLARRGQRLDLNQACELILGPVLFPR